MGSWMFDASETDKERTPKNQIRRGNRLLRRVVRRRAQRMRDIRKLFHENGLLASGECDALWRAGIDPWEMRARGLDKLLKPVEFAIALGHIAKRRGFKSAAKRKGANTAGDDQKMLKAREATKEKLVRYRTMGEMFARDPDFRTRKRNRDGIFDRTQSREDLLYEVKCLFEAQRRLGSSSAGGDLQDAFIRIAFDQRPLQDSENLVGMCLFEPDEKRAAKHAPSFEKFRLLTRLVNLRITGESDDRPLDVRELKIAAADPGKTAKLTIKAIRRRIGLPDDRHFVGIKAEDEGRDVVARTGEAMHGTRQLRNALGEELWAEFLGSPEGLDKIAHVLSFFETAGKIEEELKKLDIPEAAVCAVLKALNSEENCFARFRGVGHISAKAARALIPHLEQGCRYDQACQNEGWDHAASRWLSREQVTDKKALKRLVEDMGAEMANPVARKALTEGLKQLWAMRNRWGLPEAVHIEMLRDVGNSLETRNRIKRGIDRTTAQRERERKEAAEVLGIVDVRDVDSDTLLRYRLWKEQGSRCPYSDTGIPPAAIAATDNRFQIDHILPWSRFGDDSFNNKALCTARSNQEKRGQTPHEWITATTGQAGWEKFAARIETNKQYRGFKKRNYVLKNAREKEQRFRERNLNDTRYAARLLAEAVKLFYPEGQRGDKGGRRPVRTRPGALTAALRHAWGVESLKKIDGERVDDARHHALDALVVAAVSEWEVQRLTKSYQNWEQQGLSRPLRRVDPPWGDSRSFRRDVEQAYEDIFVAHPERRRARGEGHAATIRQIREGEEGPVIYERRAVTDLKETDVKRIKDPERNKAMIEAIRKWIDAKKPPDDLPRSPAGDTIRKVRLGTRGRPSVEVRGGNADRGDIVRVDVFSKPNRRGRDEFYVVPVYPHQVMDKKRWPLPPSRAVVGGKDEADWIETDSGFAFRCSLYPRCYVEVVKKDGTVLSGYFRGVDRSTGAISLFNHISPRLFKDRDGNSLRSIGAKTLLSMKKYSVDRFGRRFEVKSEIRTWHGAVCTSPNPPG